MNQEGREGPGGGSGVVQSARGELEEGGSVQHVWGCTGAAGLQPALH